MIAMFRTTDQLLPQLVPIIIVIGTDDQFLVKTIAIARSPAHAVKPGHAVKKVLSV